VALDINNADDDSAPSRTAARRGSKGFMGRARRQAEGRESGLAAAPQSHGA
jgi:hypothetical protein